MGHGRSIINIENKSDQIKVYETIISKNLSVRNTEELVKNYKKHKTKNFKAQKPKYISTAISKLSEIFKTNISINISGKGKGKIVSLLNLNLNSKK